MAGPVDLTLVTQANSTAETMAITFTPEAGATYLAVWHWLTDATGTNINQLAPTFSSGGSNISNGPDFVVDDRPETTDGYESGVSVHKFKAVASPSGTSTITVTASLNIYQHYITILKVENPADYNNLVDQSLSFTPTSGVHLSAVTDTLSSAPQVGQLTTVFATYNSDNDATLTPTAGFAELYDATTGAGNNPNVFAQKSRLWESTTVTVPQCVGGSGYNLFAGVAIVLTGSQNVIATDNFNRADGELGSNWTVIDNGDFSGRPVIKTNAAVLNLTSQAWDQYARFDSGAFENNQWAEADVSISSNTDTQQGSVVVRYSGSGGDTALTNADGYFGVWDNYNYGSAGGRLRICKVTNDSFSTLAETVASVPENGTQRLRIEVVGTTITFYFNGVEVLSATDATFTSGRPGIHFWSVNGTPQVAIDNFTAGDWTTPPTTITPVESVSATVSDTAQLAVSGQSKVQTFFTNFDGDSPAGLKDPAGFTSPENTPYIYLNTGSDYYVGHNSVGTGIHCFRTVTLPSQGVYVEINGYCDAPNAVDFALTSCTLWETDTYTYGSVGNGYVATLYNDGAGEAGVYIEKWTNGLPVGEIGVGYNLTSQMQGTTIEGKVGLQYNPTTKRLSLTWNGVVVDSGIDTTHNPVYAGFDAYRATSASWVAIGSFEDGYIRTPVATDNFNRANGGLGSNWITTAGSASIVTNAVQYTAAGQQHVWATAFGADHFAEVDVTLGATASDAGVTVRANGSTDTGYNFFWETANGGSYGLWDTTANQVLGTWPTGVGTTGTRKLRLEAIGTSIKGYVDGIEVISVTNSNNTGQYGGIIGSWSGGSTPTLDNFSAGNWEDLPTIIDYKVEYRTTSGPGAWQSFSDGVSATTGATVTGLSPGVSYDFRVAAVNSVGIGTWSNIATATAGSGGIINLKLGDTQIVSIKLGDTAITKAYLGDTLVLG